MHLSMGRNLAALVLLLWLALACRLCVYVADKLLSPSPSPARASTLSWTVGKFHVANIFAATTANLLSLVTMYGQLSLSCVFSPRDYCLEDTRTDYKTCIKLNTD